MQTRGRFFFEIGRNFTLFGELDSKHSFKRRIAR